MNRVITLGTWSRGERSNEDGDLVTVGRRGGMEWWVQSSDRVGLTLFRICCCLKKFASEWKRNVKWAERDEKIR